MQTKKIGRGRGRDIFLDIKKKKRDKVVVGVSVSPLSNNILVCEYNKNPFPNFFKRGLNVALSTDDPLLIQFRTFFYTKDALLEEYSICAQVFNLSSIDLCEIARNSVLQSGWDDQTKRSWIGKNYSLRGSAGNDIYYTSVPNTRLDYRALILREEENFIKMEGYPKYDKPTLATTLNVMNLDRASTDLADEFDVDAEEEGENVNLSLKHHGINQKINNRGSKDKDKDKDKDNKVETTVMKDIVTLANDSPTETPTTLDNQSFVVPNKSSALNTTSLPDVQSGQKSRNDNTESSTKGKRTREEHDTRGTRAERAQVGSRGEYDEETGQVLDENLEERKRKLSWEEFPNDLVKLDSITPAVSKSSTIDPTNMGPLLPIDLELMKEKEREKQREQAMQSTPKSDLGRSPSPKYIQNANITRPPGILKSLQMSPRSGAHEKHVSFDNGEAELAAKDHVGMPRIHTPRSLSPRGPRKEKTERQFKSDSPQSETSTDESHRRGRDKKARDKKANNAEVPPNKGQDPVSDESKHSEDDNGTQTSPTREHVPAYRSSAFVELVKTPFGTGELLRTDASHCLVKLPTMNVYVRAENCTREVSQDASAKTDFNLKLLTVRAVKKSDLAKICELEAESYPPDEAASSENLYYRFIFASEYFKVLTYNDQAVGFICGTLADSGLSFIIIIII
ncbi:AMP deaminase [Reticulomyxa filosa]|uniref:AMP deaminase n=1 Tax=Reticulomyxa filosa TaxID=46433 RepID=X6M269_RETFI|nr:AMP deaminase [Reticulomyxa filosa]|eukprot:ETO07502.1 AMP deaminase [Reticulomyxa filosa]